MVVSGAKLGATTYDHQAVRHVSPINAQSHRPLLSNKLGKRCIAKKNALVVCTLIIADHREIGFLKNKWSFGGEVSITNVEQCTCKLWTPDLLVCDSNTSYCARCSILYKVQFHIFSVGCELGALQLHSILYAHVFLRAGVMNISALCSRRTTYAYTW